MKLETILDVCQADSSVDYWVSLSHPLFYWMRTHPLSWLIVGGILVLSFLIISSLLMRGFIRLGRGRSIKRLWLWGFPVALFLSVSPLVIGEPLLTQFLPQYNGQTADAVVVLGRGKYLRANRAMMAADLVSIDRAPQVFVSGRSDAPALADLLEQLGIAPVKISGENCSITTEQNAQYAAQQLLPSGVRSIILISDPLHLLRAKLVFSSLGFRVITYSSPLPQAVDLRYRRLLAFRESLGLVTYGLMGRYLPRSISTVNTTAAQ